jgi:GNAT superfamily N-acetyltransferase
MRTPTVKIASSSDEAAVLAVLVLAFAADPATRWTWPRPDEYLRHFPAFAKILGGEALTDLMRRTSAAPAEDVATLFEQMDGFHPREPHWYLPFIGVDPAHQGGGYGGALMKQGPSFPRQCAVDDERPVHDRVTLILGIAVVLGAKRMMRSHEKSPG